VKEAHHLCEGQVYQMLFYALIEEWPGESTLFFRDLPGCFATGVTTEAAIQAAPAAIERYLSWSKENGLSVIEGDASPISIVVQERLRNHSKSNRPLFEADRAEMNELEIDLALNVAATARALIIEVVAHVPARLLEQKLTPSERSLFQHLQHILETENWYVSQLQEHPSLEVTASAMSADDVAMKIFEDAMDNEITLRDLSSEQRTHVFVHDSEEWTAAKVFRRQTAHLYEHLLCISAIEAQLSAVH
jgi:predicted RNase H-like HicB family nuclease